MTLTSDQVLKWLRIIGKVLEENRDYLTDLDAAIGDADHGINMHRGFQKVVSQLPTLADNDIGVILKEAGMALLSSVGGASGPLYGTFFLRAGTLTAGKSELTVAEIQGLLEAGLAGIKERGRAIAGDKTMVDVWEPGIAAFSAAIKNGAGMIQAMKLAADSAEAGMRDTIPMQARKGRASYLGERSIGHQDPGATSSYLIFKALFDAIDGKA